MKFYRNNDPSNHEWECDLFVNQGSGKLGLWGGYSRSNYSGEHLNIGAGAIHGSTSYTYSSDDRLKSEEKHITQATEKLMKLKPQTYMKKKFLGTENPITLPPGLDISKNNLKRFEAGLIAQEVYYDVPELRHLVKSDQDMSKIKELPTGVKPEDIHDQEWVNYGWDKDYVSSFSYTELIPYLIKMNQEQQTIIDTLKTEIDTYKAIIDKLKTANSFEDFKNSL